MLRRPCAVSRAPVIHKHSLGAAVQHPQPVNTALQRRAVQRHGGSPQFHLQAMGAASAGSSELFPGEHEALLQRNGSLPHAAQLAVDCFPVVLLGGIALALTRPEMLTHFNVNAEWSLALAQFAIALNIRPSALPCTAVHSPGAVALGLVLGYTVFPLIALVTTMFGGLSPQLALGVALLGACPPGTASNQLYAFISGAALPLVILLTTLSTLAAAALFPKIVLLISVCAGLLSIPQVSSAVAAMQAPASPAAALFTKHALFWCLAPTLLGCVAARKLPSQLQAVARGVSVPLACCYVLVTASNKTAMNAGLVHQAGWPTVAVVAAMHLIAFAVGYLLPKLTGYPERICRAMSIQASERNPAFGLMVAALYFSEPLVIAPAAIGVFLQNCLGSALATAWAKSDRT